MFSLFTQQIIGTINISIPVLILFNIYPALFTSAIGILACSMAVGAYLYYANRKQLENLTRSLLFIPTDSHKQLFDELISSCNIAPEKIILKYAYTNDMIAMAANNTLIIDPVVWSTAQGDPEADKVIHIFNTNIEPTLSPEQKTRIQAYYTALTPGAQRFIFKHELGHIFRNFSFRKLITIFITGTASAYLAITAGLYILPISGGFIAAITAMATGCITDLLFSHLSNATFKYYEEKQADLFAAQYSPTEDILAAADFFIQHQEIVDTTTSSQTWALRLSPRFASGHTHGAQRAMYLREIAHKK